MVKILFIMALLTTIKDKKAESIFIELPKDLQSGLKSKIVDFKKRIENAGAELQNGIENFVLSHEGLSKKRIKELLEDQQKEVAGIFATLKKSVNLSTQAFTANIINDMVSEHLRDQYDVTDKTLYVWQAVFVNTCQSCLELHGSRKTWAEWEAFGTPKKAPTICNGHCQCELIPALIMPSKKEMQRVIKIEAQRVRKAEKKRGKTYSTGYKWQIVGNLNNPEFRKTMNDIRKIKKVKK